MRPKLCFFENVEGHISLGLRAVIEELGSIGYKTTWGIFSAREVGAPHQRKRVFIMAYNTSLGIQGHWADWLQESLSHDRQTLPMRGGEAASNAWPSRLGEPQHEWEPPRVVGNTKELRRPRLCKSPAANLNQQIIFLADANSRQIEPPLGRDANGTASGMDYAELCISGDNRTDELRLLGNGVVPATAIKAFLTLIKQLDE
jgi:site-specific DNA-cytosine methylase